MSTPDSDELPALDDEPASGVYVDHDSLELTDDEAALGRALGEVIDVEDDDDSDGGLL